MPARARFYLNGGGLFTVGGRWWDSQVESLFGELGAEVYNPWRESKEAQMRKNVPAAEVRRAVFTSDRRGVDVSQGVIMLAEGAAGEVSSGTAWETGYAFARSKIILCVRTDLRGPLNPLMKECLFESKVCGSLEDLREHAPRAIEKIAESGAAETSYDPPSRQRKISKVFLSAPYFTAAEQAFTEELERDLSRQGLDVMFPPREKGSWDEFSAGHGDFWQELFNEKVRCLNKCDAVVALLEGADCISETGWDCGYAYSRYRPVFGMRTDFRTLGDIGGRVNLMIERSIVDSKLHRSAPEIGARLKAWPNPG